MKIKAPFTVEVTKKAPRGCAKLEKVNFYVLALQGAVAGELYRVCTQVLYFKVPY